MNFEVMLRPLSLRKNFSWSLVGNVIYAACQWGMLMAMTKLVDVEKVGLFVLATAILAPIQMFFNFQLRGVQATDARNLYCFGDYLALRLITSASTLIIAIIISLFLGKGSSMISIMLAVGFFKCADSLADIVYGAVQKYERLDKMAISKVLRGVLGVVLFTVSLYLTRSVFISLMAVFGIWTVIFFFFDLSVARKLEGTIMPRFDFAHLGRLTILSVPLGITMTMISLNTNIPRYFAEKFLGTANLGYFGALAYLVTILGTVMAAVGLAVVARLSKYYIENVGAYIRLLFKMIVVALVLGLVGVLAGYLFGNQFLSLAYTADYARHKSLLVWLLVAGGVGYVNSMLGYGMTAARLFKVQVPLIAIVTVVLLISSWLLIPRFGTVGAAWSVLAGMSVQCISASGILIWNLSVQKNC